MSVYKMINYKGGEVLLPPLYTTIFIHYIQFNLYTLLHSTHCQKNIPNFRDIIWNVVEKVENMILHGIFCVVSRFPCYISCYIAENRFRLGQCTLQIYSPLRWVDVRIRTRIWLRFLSITNLKQIDKNSFCHFDWFYLQIGSRKHTDTRL